MGSRSVTVLSTLYLALGRGAGLKILGDAIKPITHCLAPKDPSPQAARAFCDAQKGPPRTSPVAAISLPEVHPEARKKIALRGMAGSAAVEFHAWIVAAIFNGGLREAMTE